MSSERVIVVESVADQLVHEIQEIAKSECRLRLTGPI
jgi:acyl-CoA reductase-like NAD-dependent aldehyde dehydrogenase